MVCLRPTTVGDVLVGSAAELGRLGVSVFMFQETERAFKEIATLTKGAPSIRVRRASWVNSCVRSPHSLPAGRRPSKPAKTPARSSC
jgi:hypothetical protein